LRRLKFLMTFFGKGQEIPVVFYEILHLLKQRVGFSSPP
jgi:hypothetical protein